MAALLFYWKTRGNGCGEGEMIPNNKALPACLSLNVSWICRDEEQQLCFSFVSIPSAHTGNILFSSSFSLCLKPGEDLDWDEEFALQDFLKRELVERNCKEGGNQDASPKEAADKLADRAEDGEEKWMVVEKAGEEEVRGTSTPLSAHPEEAQAGLGEGQGECGEALGGISALSIIILLGNIHVHPRNKSLTEYWDCPDSLQYRIMFVYGPTENKNSNGS